VSVTLNATDRNGGTHTVPWESDQSLMEALRDNDLPVLASCGGTASCSTCHVFLPPEEVERLGARSADESELLLDNEYYQPDRSRLSCQVAFDERLDGLTVELAPEE
jgi:2Fe-2S ferredoxin